MTRLAVVNVSTLMNDDDAKTAWLAVKNQLYHHVAPLWGRKFIDVAFVPKGATVPSDCFPIYLLDNPDVAQALGYHTEDPGGKVFARVFIEPVLANGGTALSGALSVSAVLSHEVIEAFCDPNVNLWADKDEITQVAYESCDPCENDSYSVRSHDANGHEVKVSVSNFVLPAWFDPQAALSSRFDYLNRLKGPLTMSPGGYLIIRNTSTGVISNIFGSRAGMEIHGALKPAHPAARSSRRAG